jgi:hypothetical protein
VGKGAETHKLAGNIQRNLVFGITLALEKAVKALKGSIGRLYIYSFFIFGARWGVMSKTKPRPL